MNDSSRKINRRKTTYVTAVEQALGELPEADRDAILADVEDHIDAALQESGAAANLARLEAILADLGSPESYAQDLLGRSLPATPVEPKLAKSALFGMLWSLAALFVGFPAMFIVRPVPEGGPPPLTTMDIVVRSALWISLAGLIAGPALSTTALSRIRASQGRLHGLTPAVVGTWIVPLAILDLLVAAAVAALVGNFSDNNGQLESTLAMISLIVMVIWNLWFLRRTRRRYLEEMHAGRTTFEPRAATS